MGRTSWPTVVEQARRIVLGYDSDVTLRQVHYRLVAAGAIPNTPSAYRHLSAHLAAARRANRFPDLVDTVREVHVPPAWPDAGVLLAQTPALFRLDRTLGQQTALYIGAEKDSLRQMFTGWLADLGVPVVVVRGYSSQSYVQVVRERAARDQRPAVLLYFGDFDCSGEGIEADFVARTACWSHVERVLLTDEQRLAYALPPTEGKKGDPRWPAFAARHGFDPDHPVQWEVEALDPAELRRLLEGAIDPYIDRDALAAVLAEERRQRHLLARFVRGWSAEPDT
ncbi:hypothetical protein ACIHEI_33945 [Kitasatospora sp. NPDC051984]|uniref:hypothetical protein n=1 Tax=Kitasatospora sp. NPDC051984 TaxID=3364059 RepID=UPI0037C553E2